MDRKNMLRKLKAGKKPIDLAIKKWEDICSGRGMDDGLDNCALCETSNCSMGSVCPLHRYSGNDAGCGKGYEEYQHAKNPVPMLQKLIQCREYMIADGAY